MFAPWRRYRNWISTDLEPQVHDPGWSVVGINSVNPLGWQRGWFDKKDIETVRQGFAQTPAGAFRIVVVHHPLEHLPGEQKKLMRGADLAISSLAQLGTDIVLSGHLHSWRADVFAATQFEPTVLQVHAGTGLSDRYRGQENDFNLLTLDDETVRVERYISTGTDFFRQDSTIRFRRITTGWEADMEGTTDPTC
ncbi:metallophosphoesterase family protein [Tateyamaria pelophila]|uniref:metallophosphoesterase family protein n=1 Tax=Tateyamaria pelophila TaxID=328415 RepID=UPI001CBDA6D6|nr:metallophosphoesterase [Tateyamaria pelophila]